ASWCTRGGCSTARCCTTPTCWRWRRSTATPTRCWRRCRTRRTARGRSGERDGRRLTAQLADVVPQQVEPCREDQQDDDLPEEGVDQHEHRDDGEGDRDRGDEPCQASAEDGLDHYERGGQRHESHPEVLAGADDEPEQTEQ